MNLNFVFSEWNLCNTSQEINNSRQFPSVLYILTCDVLFCYECIASTVVVLHKVNNPQR